MTTETRMTTQARSATRETRPTTDEGSLPLTGIRVVEFTHMLMGPTCGMILRHPGAEVR